MDRQQNKNDFVIVESEFETPDAEARMDKACEAIAYMLYQKFIRNSFEDINIFVYEECFIEEVCAMLA